MIIFALFFMFEDVSIIQGVKKLLFIYNPKAGPRKNPFNIHLLEKKINSSFTCQSITTRAPRHATQIVEDEKDNYDLFIAVGGDGTVNEVGKALIHSNKSLGIIPTGSGNGLAQELGIRKSHSEAMDLLFHGNEKKIDTLRVNDEICLNVTGVGFDAEVAFQFEKHNSRGFLTYVYSTLKTLVKFKPVKVTLRLNDEVKIFRVFSITFANSRQFGNNAYIAPGALLDDGLMDIAIIHPFPLFQLPSMALRLFSKSLPKAKYYTGIRTRKVEVLEGGQMNWHIDGEPVRIRGPVTIQVDQGSLRVIGK
jgi:diacylglycerol kinase (ATP)